MTGAASSLKLSPRLKALIALPAARGAAIPAGPVAKTRELLDRIRAGGEKGGVGRETWLSLTTAAIFTVNSPETLCQLYDYAAEGQPTAEKVQVAALMRETGLKCISFGGIPRAINNLNALRAHLPADVAAGLSTKSQRTPDDIKAIYNRGRELWDGIYEPHSVKLIKKLGDSHPDLPVHILNSHYGPLLSDPAGPAEEGNCKVGRVLTSLIAIAALRAQTGVGPQVTSHVFGLKKALLEGGGGDGRKLQGQEWLTSDDGVQWAIESVDDLAAAIRSREVIPGKL